MPSFGMHATFTPYEKFDFALQSTPAICSCYTDRRGCLHGVPVLVICQLMQANAKPAVTPGDGAPASEDPALIKMSNQHTKFSQARSEEPAPTTLNDQRNSHAMLVRAHNGCRAVP